MVVVRIKGRLEYWKAQSMGDIQRLVASISINAGFLLQAEQVYSLPENMSLSWTDGETNVEVYKPSSPEALSNAQHQKQFRERKAQTHRLLRAWVPIDKYEQAKEFCRNL